MPRRTAAAVLTCATVLLAAGCGDDSGGLGEDAALRVYVSLPMRGPSAAEARDAADGARLALADAGGEAGGAAVEAVFLDGSEPGPGGPGWTPVRAAENARRAIQDSTAIAYLGEFESGATRASLPITNEALMLQVSPASAAVDLVTTGVGEDELPAAQPAERRSFGRVIPADDAQAAAAAGWVQKSGAGRVRIVSDRTPFARHLADAFTLAASDEGVEVTADAPYSFLAGRPEPAGGREIGTDAYLLPTGQEAPATVTSAALDPSHLAAGGTEFRDRFEQRFGREPGRYAAYGYEAMAVILDSIERASEPADRTAVVDAFFETTDRESVLGRYSIDELGNTTLNRITIYRRDGDRWVAAASPVSG